MSAVNATPITAIPRRDALKRIATLGVTASVPCLFRAAFAKDATATGELRDDGTYQNGGYWATPLPWLMVTLMRADPERAASAFCDAVEDFQARNDVNEWINANAKRRAGVRNYCASAAMPLAGVKRLRLFLAESGRSLPADLAKRLDAAEAWLRPEAKRILRGGSRISKAGVRIFTPDATGGYGAFWVRDWSYQIEGCPEAFTRQEIRDGYLFLAAAQRKDGCMPDRVRGDGRGVYSPGPATKPFSVNGSVDQSPFMVIVCHQYWKLHDDLGPFRRTADALEKAMRFTPRNPDNGLVAITDATLFRPYSFFDTVPLVGDQQFAVWQLGNARLVVALLPQRDPLARNSSRQMLRVADFDEIVSILLPCGAAGQCAGDHSDTQQGRARSQGKAPSRSVVNAVHRSSLRLSRMGR